MQSLEISFLGTTSIKWHGRSIVPTAGKPRQLLVLLALNCGGVVPVSTLMDELWGDAIPRSGSTTLQTYVLQLRRLITESLPSDSADCAKDLLATHFHGYKLEASPEWCDLREFERMSAKGDAALEAGNLEKASESFAAALELWRGPALMDVPTGRVLAMEVIGMEEGRMRVLEQRIFADLSLGKHGMLIPELCMLVAQHPMHEAFSGLLMIAFHRSGASWRALQTFQQLRRTLIDELGVEPSDRLQRLHQSVLCNSSSVPLQSFSLV